MADSMASLTRRMRAAEELLTVTRTMRGIAAAGLRRFEEANHALTIYEATVENGLQVAMRNGRIDRLPLELPVDDDLTLIVAFGSDHGLCGAVNRHVADQAVQRIGDETRLLVVGHRLAAELEALEHPADGVWELPGRIETVTPLVARISHEATVWREARRRAPVIAVLPHLLDRRRGYEVVELQVAPTDRELLAWLAVRQWPSRVLPTFTVAWEELVPHLLQQMLVVRLHRAVTQTMASVAWSRLVAMDAAEQNVEDHLESLRRRSHRVRQEATMAELLDVISGAEAVQS